MAIKLPFGFRTKDKRYVDVKSVDNGKACGCICPVCQLPLVAKNRATNVKVAHFSHSSDCTAAYETVIHETAKQIVRDQGFVWLPKSPVAAKTKFAFTNQTLEKPYDRLVPDVMVWNNDKDKLAIEIYVTHPVEHEKRARLRKLGLSCVEFDLSELPREIHYDNLRKMFAEGLLRSTWIFNRKAHEKELQKLTQLKREATLRAKERLKTLQLAKKEAVARPVLVRKNRFGYDVYHVDPCPIGVRKGFFANVNLDCRKCDYCARIKVEKRIPLQVMCGGHTIWNEDPSINH